jgi:glycosyltransferase involved in cell wall biosynthesis
LYRTALLFFYIHWFSFLGVLLSPFISRKKKANSILYLAAFFPGNAGYHWRVQKWVDQLHKEGKKVSVSIPLNGQEFKQLLDNDHQKFLIKSLKRRFWQVVRSGSYETVIVRRELLLCNDYGNLFLEKLLLKIHPNAILDFDDDLAAAKNQPKEITNLYGKLLRENGNKFNESLQRYKWFIVASDYLKKRVLEQNKEISEDAICVIPTCVDYDQYDAKHYPENASHLTIGWIGGDYNYPLLEPVFKVLDELADQYQFSFLVIGGSPIERQTKFPLQFSTWSLKTEITDLKKIDIGVMPLIDDEESRGKGGFKLLQYMGLGIVSIASPITINKDIVIHGKNSFLANGSEEWKRILESALKREINLVEIGSEARKRISSHFSFKAHKSTYVQFLNRICHEN